MISDVAIFEPPFRSRKVLDHARGQRCTLRFNCCNGQRDTTVSCHITDRYKGFGIKACDSSTVYGCAACHDYIDRGLWLGDLDEADMLRVIIRAMQETTSLRIKEGIYGFPHDKPKPSSERKTPPRKPKDQRAKVSAGRPLPTGRKLESQNNLRRRKT